MTPIFQTSTYVQNGVGNHRGYEYSRTGNPTRTALEDSLAALEGGEFGLAFSSGMAATDTVLRLLHPGDHVLAGNDVYGGTYRLFEQVLHPYGLEFTYIDTTDPKNLEDGMQDNTQMIWIETPTNPYLKLTDIAAIAELAKKHHGQPWLVVDNTFATPFLQKPLSLGADLVVHSTTKYIGGHSDLIGGAIIGLEKSLHDRLAFLQNAVGAVPGPMDCFLALRGIKTLHVRMARHSENAQSVANFLSSHPKVAQIFYPHHKTHPQMELAHEQMKAGGGMVAFIHKDGAHAAHKVAEHTRIFALAESLGGVESLIEVPAAMTHASTVNSPFAVDPDLVRLSVGIEHINDLIADLQQALG